MHVLQVGAFPYPSPQGSQVYVRGIAKGLAARGHRVSVLCYGYGTTLTDDSYEVLRIPNLSGYNNMRAGPDLIKPLLDLGLAYKLSTLRPDIVHVHNYEAPIAEYLAGLRRRLPVVYSAHNLMEEELHTYFKRPMVRKTARKIGRLLDCTIPRRADHCIAIREETVGTLRRLGCRNVSCVSPRHRFP